MLAPTLVSIRKTIKINTITRFDELPLAHAPVSVLAVVRDVLEEILVECAGGGEGAQAGGHQEPAAFAKYGSDRKTCVNIA